MCLQADNLNASTDQLVLARTVEQLHSVFVSQAANALALLCKRGKAFVSWQLSAGGTALSQQEGERLIDKRFGCQTVGWGSRQ